MELVSSDFILGFNLYLKFVLFFSLSVALIVFFNSDFLVSDDVSLFSRIEGVIRHSLFQVVSIVTTTGLITLQPVALLVILI